MTLWEALSHGAKPYQVCSMCVCVCVCVSMVGVDYSILPLQNMQGQEILKMIEGGHRMNPPKDCPTELYDVMISCWSYR